MTSIATTHGYPRQGRRRELKRAIERYWKGGTDAATLLDTAATLRRQRLERLRDAGLGEVPVGDFSLYDHVLDTAWMVGAIPPRHAAAVPDTATEAGRLDRYFAMARGDDRVQPLEMTKWFDTNYHYLVPELSAGTEFTLDPTKIIGELAEAAELGVAARPVLVGPVTFLLLAKSADDPDFAPISLLDKLILVYAELLGRLAEAGAAWVQLDEPVLVTDLDPARLAQVREAYATLAAVPNRPKIIIGSYFDRLGEAAPLLASAPVEGLAVDLVGPGAASLDELAGQPGLAGKRLIAGVVDGRNVWRTDLAAALGKLGTLLGLVDRLDVASSSSLLHVPIDVTDEPDLDPTVAGWLAFADQKLEELAILARALNEGRDAVAGELTVNATRLASRASSPIVRDQAVRERLATVSDDQLRRRSAYPVRAEAQHDQLKLPAFPTTTIGSFPQTTTLRQARADLRAKKIDNAAYDQAMRDEIAEVIKLQTELGVDVLVHGEPERNDMVQYFADQLVGFLSTRNGWVQSYGTRCVRPPIIVGDVSRPRPMTVDWASYAQGLTDRPVKGMLTGPVTMLAWSFVRDDQPLGDTARQVALALRDEVTDLEAAGIRVIQVDEPALRETLPLRRADRPAYLDWAVAAFQLSTTGVADATQIHTHMCYAEFGDIVDAIVAMDADVISLEAARSRMEVVGELSDAGYPREVGPGVWDIHSPRVPPVEEMIEALRLAGQTLPAERLWANPDCGLKTRGYAEVEQSLRHLVAAAKQVRTELSPAG